MADPVMRTPTAPSLSDTVYERLLTDPDLKKRLSAAGAELISFGEL